MIWCFTVFSLCFISNVHCGRWMLMGGYQGVEGENGTSSMDDVELLTLEDEQMYNYESAWCQRTLPSAAVSLDGATIDMINSFDYVESYIGDTAFTSPHNSHVFERAIVCGGADPRYNITAKCRYYMTLFI